MARRFLIGLLVMLVLGGGLAWLNRKEIILFLVINASRTETPGPTQPINWQTGPATPTPAGASRPPNIIFILADDLGINDITAFGRGVADGKVPTPNIDRLAAMGANFRQAYAGTASCAPSRAMIMTGRYPTRTGFEFTPTPGGMTRIVSLFANSDASGLPPLWLNEATARNELPYADQGLPGSEVTIAEVLKQRGYHTVHIGKWHTGLGKEFGPNAQGFDESLLMASGLFLPEDDPNVVNAKLPFDPIDRFLWARMDYAASFNEGPWFRPGGYLTDWWTDEAVKVIQANRNRPFFLKLAHWAPHTPLQATREDYEAVGDLKPERLRVYAAMIRALDRSVGRLLDTLEAEGLADNTLVVFTSDNGGAGYIGLPGVNQPYRGWKLTLFEGGIRVPLLMAWPGQIPAGQQPNGPVAHIDMMPTLAAAAAAPLPANVAIDGTDLLPFARNPARSADRPHDVLFWQSAHYRAVRKGDWKLQVSQRPQKVWLYDLATDPTERTNLAAARPDVLAELQALLDAHQKNARPPLYPHALEAPVAVDKTLAEKVGPGDEVVFWPN